MPNETDAASPRTIEQALPPFARLMGVRVTNASRDRVEAELTVGGD